MVCQVIVRAWVPGAVSMANGVVYAGSISGIMYGLSAQNGQIIWSFDSGGSVVDGPSISAGTVREGVTCGNIGGGGWVVSGKGQVYSCFINFSSYWRYALLRGGRVRDCLVGLTCSAS